MKSTELNWQKQGHIFVPDGTLPWARSHAQVPLALPLNDDVLRIYYGTRDEQNRTRTSFIDVNPRQPQEINYIHPVPILELGSPGTFDDAGVMPSAVVNKDGLIYFFYVGWNVGHKIRYRTALGLAVSEDGGLTFKRVQEKPVLDRVAPDPLSTSCQSILIENGIWRSWYMSYTHWQMRGDVNEPFYHIKYAQSQDGINWLRENRICIDLKEGEGGIACPSVLKLGNQYIMWYSRRGSGDYRLNPDQSYRIGMAISDDGLEWQRRDAAAGIDISTAGWDANMIAYPDVTRNGDELRMLYNGNDFGRTGFGYAKAQLNNGKRK